MTTASSSLGLASTIVPSAAGGRGGAGGPLVVTRDAALAGHLHRLAAAVGATLRVSDEPATALRAWSGAALVLVGLDLLEEVATLAPARRAGVHVVAWAPVPDHAYRGAVDLGAQHVLEVPRCDDHLGALLSDLDDRSPGPGLVVGVLAGCGGAGASVFAAALAGSAAAEGPCLAVDLDPLGPGLDRVAGLDEEAGVRWDDLARTVGRLGAAALREAVPRRDGLGVLTWGVGAAADPEPSVAREALAAARRGHDLVVVDLPTAPGPAARETLARLDRLVVTTRPGVLAGAATLRRCARAGELVPDGVAPLLVVRGSAVDAARLERATGASVLVSMGPQRGLDEDLDLGLGPVRRRRGALARAAQEALALLHVRGPGTATGAGLTREPVAP